MYSISDSEFSVFILKSIIGSEKYGEGSWFFMLHI